MKTLSGISQILFNRFYCIFRTLPCVFCTLAIASSVSAQETDNAMLKYGLNFLKTPYVAHTLEVNEEEKDDVPKTGVESYLGLAILTIIASTAGIVYMKKKEEK